MRTLVFYTREGCHLCDEALVELERIRTERPALDFTVSVVDLDREAPPEKRAAYDHDVPVIELEGRKLMKYRIDEVRLVRLLGG